MRIVIDLQSCQNGSRHRGIGRYAMAMTKALIRLDFGHEFRIILSDAFPETVLDVRKELEGILLQEHILILSLPSKTSFTDPANAWRTKTAEILRARFIDNLIPDVLFVPSLFEGYWDRTVVSIETSSYPVAVTLYDLIPLEYPVQHLPQENDRAGYFHKLNNLRQADLLLAISDFVAVEATTRLGMASERVVSTPLGVDDIFRVPVADGIDRSALMQRYGINRPFVLNTSPLEFRKNIEGLIAGFASIRREIRDAYQLVIVGRMNADAHRYVASLVAAEGLMSDAVILVGFVPDADLVALYNQCELFCFPSLSEGFGLPVLEAMACGAPVVGSGTTSIPEVIGREDLLFDPLDASAMGRAMERILENPALQAELRVFGPARAARFSWNAAAATAMAAFERLHAAHNAKASSTGWKDASLPIRPKLAVVVSTMASQHALTGSNIAIFTALADRNDMVLICPEGFTDDPWVNGLFEIKDFDWFDVHAGNFDRILYSAEPRANGHFVSLMEEHPGLLIVQMPISDVIRTNQMNRHMPANLQRALFAVRGYAGLMEALEGKISAAQAQDTLVEQMRKNATLTLTASTLAEDDAIALSIVMPPLSRSSIAAAQFRADRGIPSRAPLIAGFVSDESAAMRLINAFRSSRIARETEAHLLLYVIDGLPLFSGEAARRMFGNIHHLTMLDPIYRGMMSAADLSICMAPLADKFVERIRRDAVSCGQSRPWIEGDSDPTDLAAAFDICRTVTNAWYARRRDAMEMPASLSEKVLDRLQNALWARLPAEDLASRRRLAALLPTMVRSVEPDGHDLAEVAIAMARNEAHMRVANIYCDISAFASAGANRRLDPLSKEFLLAVLRYGGRNIHPIYTNGSRFITATWFAHGMLGFDATEFSDTPVVFRPGDRIIGFDLLASFQTTTFPSLRNAVEHGAAVSYTIAGHLPLERADILPEIIDLALEWARARPASMASHLTPPEVATVRTPGSDPTLACLTMERLVAAGIPVDVLAADRKPLRLAAEIPMKDSVSGQVSSLMPIALPTHAVAAQERLSTALKQRRDRQISNALEDMHYVITGHLLGSYSLAIINRGMARTLERAYPDKVRYYPVETLPINHTEGVPIEEKAQMMALSARPAAGADREIVISHHYPVLLPEGNYRLAFALFFWEESHVPLKTIQLLEKGFDSVISPASSVTKALIDSGLRIPIATIGQAPGIASYQAIASQRPSGYRTKTFLHVSSCFKRKGIDILLAAWGRAFTMRDDVRLVIKTFPNPHNNVEKQIADLRTQYPEIATIDVVNRDVEQSEMPEFYANADVMVLPSRGEGYNLPALEAMAAGLPLIVTGHGGHRDFCGPEEARLIGYRFEPSESHVGSSHSMWVEPDIDDLVRALREFVDPAMAPVIEARRTRAMIGAATESDPENWLRRHAAMVSTMLTMSAGGPPRTAWVSTWNVQCGIAQYSDYLLKGMSAAARERTVVLCDERTVLQQQTDLAYDPVWIAGAAPKADRLAEAVHKHNAECVVIQHQDGLISWEQIGRIGAHPRLADTVKIAVLHNARNLHRVGGDELPMVLAGLAAMSRILVHNIDDINFLLGFGLSQNVGLLPHGAMATSSAPWPRALDRDDDPVIGCHGFFFRHKGIDKLIRAAAMLRHEWPGLRLRLINARFPGGDHDAIIAECQSLAIELGMSDAIEWYLDFMPIARVNELLSECDLLVLPYNESDDSASGAVRVSLSSMVPLVTTRVKIFAELGTATASANSNHPTDLADTIASLLRSPGKRRAVQAGMHDWLLVHDWKRVAGTLEGMIEGLVKQKRFGWDRMRD